MRCFGSALHRRSRSTTCSRRSASSWRSPSAREPEGDAGRVLAALRDAPATADEISRALDAARRRGRRAAHRAGARRSGRAGRGRISGYDRARERQTAGRALRAVALVSSLRRVPRAGGSRGSCRGRRRQAVRATPAYADRGAVGLLVPGAGSTVTRAGALSSLVRGKVVSSLLGGKSDRDAADPAVAATPLPRDPIYVIAAAAGRSHNTRRYPIAIVGGGYRGLLASRHDAHPRPRLDRRRRADGRRARSRARRRGSDHRADADAPAVARASRRAGCATHTTRERPPRSSSSRSTLVLAGLGADSCARRALARAGSARDPGGARRRARPLRGGVSRRRRAATVACVATGTVVAGARSGARRAVLLPALLALPRRCRWSCSPCGRM